MAQPSDFSNASRRDRSYLALCAWLAAIAAALVAYSQTLAFAYDEGFHLLTAQLIAGGRLPYLDFFFPQTPLNAFWNAAWMRAFGESWRVTHVAAALATSAAVWLTADFVYVRCGEPRWRLPAALTAAVAFGLNPMAMEFGTIGQAYGLCVFLTVAAFRAAVASVEARGILLAAIAGLLSAAAAGSTLLAAPLAPVLGLWALWQNRAGNRWLKGISFLIGCSVAVSPIAWLYAQGPRRVWFNIVDYHLRYREVQWSGALRHNLEVVTAWMLSPPALLLGGLALAGLLFVRYRSGWARSARADLCLCAWLIAALAVHISRAEPTFERYYILCVPFLAILAAFGLYSLASRLLRIERQVWLTALVMAIFSLSLARRLYDEREDASWHDYEAIARKVDEVTPRGASLLAEEHIYFLTRRTPLSGLEHRDAHKLEKPIPGLSFEHLHVLPRSRLDPMIVRGDFDTVEICKDEGKIAELKLPEMYRQKAEIGDCTVFWDRAPKSP